MSILSEVDVYIGIYDDLRHNASVRRALTGHRDVVAVAAHVLYLGGVRAGHGLIHPPVGQKEVARGVQVGKRDSIVPELP